MNDCVNRYGDLCELTYHSLDLKSVVAYVLAAFGILYGVKLFKRERSTGDPVYNVWVGGVLDAEGVDYFTAVEISDDWKAQGYDDVAIELSQD